MLHSASPSSHAAVYTSSMCMRVQACVHQAFVSLVDRRTIFECISYRSSVDQKAPNKRLPVLHCDICLRFATCTRFLQACAPMCVCVHECMSIGVCEKVCVYVCVRMLARTHTMLKAHAPRMTCTRSWEAEEELAAEFSAEIAAYRARCKPIHQQARRHSLPPGGVEAGGKAAKRACAFAELRAGGTQGGEAGQMPGPGSTGSTVLLGRSLDVDAAPPAPERAGPQAVQVQRQEAGQQELTKGADGLSGEAARAAAGVGSGARRFTATPPWLAPCGNLHPYQLEGLNWLFHKWASKENVVLADEVRRGAGNEVSKENMVLADEVRGAGAGLCALQVSAVRGWHVHACGNGGAQLEMVQQ